MWQNLIETLDGLSETYDSLVNLGERKRAALVSIDAKSLSEILDEEHILIAKIQKLEQNRVEILKDLSKSDKTITEKTRATDFYRSAPSRAIEQKLIAAHNRLSKNVERALQLRENNQVLAQCALDAVQFQLNKLNGAAVEPTYSGTGSDIVSHKKNFDFEA